MFCYQLTTKFKIEIPKDILIVVFDNSKTAVNLKPVLNSIQLSVLEMTTAVIERNSVK